MGLNNIIDNVSLTDILATPTEEKEVNPLVDKHQTQLNPDDFIDEPIHPQDHIPDTSNFEDNEEEDDEDYDAEQEAQKLIALLSAMNSLVVTPIANWKLRKNIGGKKTLNRMQSAYIKKTQGKELSDNEETLLIAFEQYKKDLQLLSGEIPYSDAEIETLNKLAVPYLEESKMKINGAGSFWTVFGGMQISRILKVLM